MIKSTREKERERIDRNSEWRVRVKKAINRHKFTEKKRVELKQWSKKRGHGLTTDQMRMTEGGREKRRQDKKKNRNERTGNTSANRTKREACLSAWRSGKGLSEEGEVNLRGVVEEEDEEEEDEEKEDEDEDEERKEKKRRSDKKAWEKKRWGRQFSCATWVNKMTQTTIRAKAERMSELQKLDEGHE